MAEDSSIQALPGLIDGDPTALDDTTKGSGALTPDVFAGLLQDFPAGGEGVQQHTAGLNALIQGRGTNDAAINVALVEPDYKASLAVVADNFYKQLEDEVAAIGRGLDEVHPENALEVLEQVVSAQKKINELKASSVAAEEAALRKSANTPLSASIRREKALELAANTAMQDMLDNVSLWDNVKDIGGLFIPLAAVGDTLALKEAVNSHTELRGFMNGDSIDGMYASWQALPIERREALLPSLIEAILISSGSTTTSLKTAVQELFPTILGEPKHTPNTFLAAQTLASFFNTDGATQTKIIAGVDIAFAALDLLTFGASKIGRIKDINKLPLSLKKDMEAIIANATEYAAKAHNPVKKVAEAEGIETAAHINLKAMEGGAVSKAFNTSKEEAFNNALPFTPVDGDVGKIDGLSGETAKIVNDFARVASGFTRSMTTESSLIRIGALNKSERKLVTDNFLKQMDKKGEDFLNEGIHLEDVKIIGEEVDKFTFEYTLSRSGGSGGDSAPVTKKGFRTWGINQVTGNYDETLSTLTSATASRIPGLSPSAWSVTKPGKELDFNDTVKDFILLDDVSGSITKGINELFLDANKGIGGSKAFSRIHAIEVAGDEFVNKGSHINGRVFTEEELIAGIKTGIPTETGQVLVRLTKPSEIVTYYKRRLVADSLYTMQNYVTRRELILGGFEQTSLKLNPVIAKPFKNAGSAKLSISNKPGFHAYISTEDISSPLTNDLIDTMYDQGRILVRLKEDFNVTGAGNLAQGGERVEYAFVKPHNMRELQDNVLHYSPGYVPQIDEGVEFVVKQISPVIKAGVSSATRSLALRKFSSRRDAQTFINDQAEKFAKDNDISIEDATKLFEIKDGSVMSQFERMESALSGSNGLFTGERASQRLLMGLDAVPIERVNPSEAMGRYADHLGNVLARNEARIGAEKRWINTVRKADSSIRVRGFSNTALPNTPVGKALGKMRDQIDKFNRVPTQQESLFEGMAQKYHDTLLRIPNSKIGRRLGLEKNNIKHALWLKHTNPSAAILNANTHVYLGFLSPAQLYVQSMSATMALSLVRIASLPRVMLQTASFSILDLVKADKALEGTLSMWVKNAFIGQREATMYRAWRASGMLDNIRGNADINYISSTGVGLTNDVLRKAGNLSLLFYRAGESTNRRISFISAYTRFEDDNPSRVIDQAGNIIRVIDTDAIVDIIKEANKTMGELHTANKAWWQGGAGANAVQKILSVMTQFFQVGTKSVELALKTEKRGGFRLTQKARMGLGQVLFFGAAGVPILNAVAPSVMDWLGIESTPENAAIINQGLQGALVVNTLGADIDVSSRSSVFGAAVDFVEDLFTSKDPLWAKALGLVNETGRRVVKAGEEINLLVRSRFVKQLAELEPLMLHDRSGETNMDMPSMLQAAADIAVSLLGITTTARNALTAYIMHNSDRILDRREGILLEEDFNFATEIGVLLGFQPSAKTRLRIASLTVKDYDELVDTAVESGMNAYWRWVSLHNMAPEYAVQLKNTIQLLQEGLNSQELVDRLTTRMQNRILNPKTQRERVLNKLIKNLAPEKVAEGAWMDLQEGFNPGNIFNKEAITLPFQHTLESGTYNKEE